MAVTMQSAQACHEQGWGPSTALSSVTVGQNALAQPPGAQRGSTCAGWSLVPPSHSLWILARTAPRQNTHLRLGSQGGLLLTIFVKY